MGRSCPSPAHRGPVYVRFVRAVALVLSAQGLAASVHAQTARWTGVQALVAETGLSTPHGVAVDANLNIYIADVGNNRVLKETPSSGGYQETVVASTGLHSPSGIAVDAGGNIYIADFGDSRILKETFSNGTYSESVVPTVGLSSPLGIAVDGSGNLYITDSGNARVIKETWNGSTYTQSFVFGGPFWPDGIAVDASGNIYVCAPYDGYVIKIAPQGNGYSPAYTFNGMSQAHGVAVDASGNVFIAESGTGRILRETANGGSYTQSIQLSGLTLPQAIALDSTGTLYFNNPQDGQIFKFGTSPQNFGPVDVGSSRLAAQLTFVFDNPGTIAAPSVVTRGLSGLDFTDLGTGTCTANGTAHFYSAGDTCTVDVSFKPRGPGTRFGATILRSASGNIVATAYIQGTGAGSRLRFPPGNISTLPLPSLTGPLAIASDESNIYSTQAYTAYDPRNSVVKETWNGSSYTQSTIATNLGFPTALAVDGAGNVYVSDQDDYAVYKFTPTPNGSYTKTTVDSLGTVGGLAVDGAGNVYIGRGGIGIEKETLSNGSYLPTQIFYGFYGHSIAVDGNGVLYLSDGNNLRKETPSAGGYTESIIASGGVSDVKVDALGNVYYLRGGSQIEKLTWTGSAYQESQIETGHSNLASLATDGSGNILFSTYDYSSRLGNIFLRTTIDAPSLSFASTPYKSTSSDSPKTITIENAGNKALTLPIPATGSNPGATAGFAVVQGGSRDCPSVDSNSASAGSLDVGQSCDFAISFSPVSIGQITGDLALTSDSVTSASPANSTIDVHLYGTGVQAMPTISWVSPSPITYGNALSSVELDATSHVAGTFTYSPALGTILSAGTQTLTTTFAPTDTTNFVTAQATSTLVINRATPSVTLSSSAPSAVVSGLVTLKATVAFSYGTPTGSVVFADGPVNLGTGTLNAGVATFTTSSLAAGSRAITAIYSGDSNFTPATSAAFAQSIFDFDFGPGKGSATSATVGRAGTANFTLAVTPVNGQTTLFDLTFSVAGLPPGATATFSPVSVSKGSGTTDVKLTVSLPAATARMSNSAYPFSAPFLIALALVPLVGTRRMWRHVRASSFCILLLLIGIATGAAISGCGGGAGSSGGSHAQPQTYTLVVTANGGTLTHSTNLNLTVQ